MDTFSCTHTCRTKAFDNQIKKQQTRNNQERQTVFTHYYNKGRGPNFGSQNNQNFNQQPDTDTRTTIHPTDRLASTQIRTEIQTQIDNSNKTDQATPGTTDQITVNNFSITSMIDQRTLILSTTETSHRATIYLHPTQFSSPTTRDKM